MQTPEACRCNVRPKLQCLAPSQARSMGPCRNEWVGDGKPVAILPAKLIWPGKPVTFQTRAPTLKCDCFLPLQLSKENGNPSDFPAHPELQKSSKCDCFFQNLWNCDGFLQNPSLFWGQSSFQVVMGFLTTQPNGFGYQKCDVVLKPVAIGPTNSIWPGKPVAI